jgi:aminoglycoside phosphotransferase (APT) family kinase protein
MAHGDNDKEHIITKDKTPKGWDHVKIGDRRVELKRSLTFSSSNCH